MKTPTAGAPEERDRGQVPCPVRRWAGGRWERGAQDVLATEEPLEIRVDSRSVAVIMRTPGHDEELALGFLRSEGVIVRREDVVGVRRYPRNQDGNVVDVFLAEHVRVDLAGLSRHVFAASSCGLCGASSIAAVQRRFPRARTRFRVAPEVLLALPERMRQAQRTFAATGAAHAAALFTVDGELVHLREDVGRHNAVDKVLGRVFLDGGPKPDRHLLLASGRVSFEIVQKALAGGIAMVAAVSAPTTLAVAFARRGGQTLVGFLREGRFNVYSGAARIGGRAGSR